jgi:hypothetical protein
MVARGCVCPPAHAVSCVARTHARMHKHARTNGNPKKAKQSLSAFALRTGIGLCWCCSATGDHRCSQSGGPRPTMRRRARTARAVLAPSPSPSLPCYRSRFCGRAFLWPGEPRSVLCVNDRGRLYGETRPRRDCRVTCRSDDVNTAQRVGAARCSEPPGAQPRSRGGQEWWK